MTMFSVGSMIIIIYDHYDLWSLWSMITTIYDHYDDTDLAVGRSVKSLRFLASFSAY